MIVLDTQFKEKSMRALTATAIVRPDHVLTVQMPTDVAPGAHQVVVVLQEGAPAEQKGELLENWPAHDAQLVNPHMSFRREDIYGDDGR
jgi:hypothetical protein